MQKYLFSNENFLENLNWRRLTLQKSIMPNSFKKSGRFEPKCLKNYGAAFRLVKKKVNHITVKQENTHKQKENKPVRNQNPS